MDGRVKKVMILTAFILLPIALTVPTYFIVRKIKKGGYKMPDKIDGVTANGVKLLQQHEGLRLKAYKDPVGILTIGYGHTGSDVKPNMVITKARAVELLINDLDVAENHVRRYVKVPLTQNQFNALVSFTYNLGGGTLKKSTLLKLLNEKNYEGASSEFRKFVFAGNKKLAGLVKRRADEQLLFLKT